MYAVDTATGKLYECDAVGPCEECGTAGPLYLVGDFRYDDTDATLELLCWRCRLGRLCPAFAHARNDYGRRGTVSSGSITIAANAWAGEIHHAAA